MTSSKRLLLKVVSLRLVLHHAYPKCSSGRGGMYKNSMVIDAIIINVIKVRYIKRLSGTLY